MTDMYELIQVVATGEIVEAMGRVEAERVTHQIADKLDGIADNLELVMPLIREALTREAWRALGYSGVSDYVSSRFATALARMPQELRQPVVRELSAAGMSTRAIAPVVGASHTTVSRDLAGVTSVTPPTITGLDGKAYQTRQMSMGEAPIEPGVVINSRGQQRPASYQPRQAGHIDLDTGEITDAPETRDWEATAPKPPRRRPIAEAFASAAHDLDKLANRIHNLVNDDRYPRNKNEVARYRNDLARNVEALQRLIDSMA